jgi:hypothetical protein
VLERGKLIDSEAKRITAAIAEVEGPIDAMIKAEEERKAEAKRLEEAKELARVRDIQAKITELGGMWTQCIGVSSGFVEEVLDLVAGKEIGDSYAEFAEQAQAVKDEAVERIEVILADVRKREEEEAEERRLQEEREARRRVEEERLKAEREELAKQRAAQEAKERELANREAEQEAERLRLAEEERQRQLQETERMAKEEADRLKSEAESEEAAAPPVSNNPARSDVPDYLLLDSVQMEIEKAFEYGFAAGLAAQKTGSKNDAGRLSSEYLSGLLSGEGAL